ncbi:MAG: hypothetical protein JO304_26535 [Solirubrobacterales bacterium]|nr:hypothetical protein [Solirubrobacterales bacterium]
MAERPTPVLDVLAQMTARSVEASNLDTHSVMLVRLAAMAAIGRRDPTY